MQLLIAGLIGLILHASVGSEELLEGRVRLSSGEPVVGATVRLTDRGRLVNTTATDARGWFALPLRRTALPITFTLGQNYPNPFNPSTVIPYQLSAASHVRLEVFNLLGQHLATLVDAYMSAGRYEARWGGTDAAGRAVGAGVYIYQMTVGVESQVGRMVLIDGQAGLSAGGAASVLSGASDVSGRNGEGGQVYGLIVSGSGLVPYVDPAFRVEAGMAPVELIVSSGLHSAGKAMDDDCTFCDLFDALNDAQEEEEAGPSGKAQATLAAPAAPTNLRFEAVTDSSCRVRWDAAEGATDYDVNYKPAVGGKWTNEPHKGIRLYNTIYDLEPNTEYRWAARSENSDGPSEWVFGPNFTTVEEETQEEEEESPSDSSPSYPGGGRIYWLETSWKDRGDGDTIKNVIYRASLDGSNTETLYSTLEGQVIHGVTLDIEGGWLYWQQAASVWRTRLDGSGVEEIVPSPSGGYIRSFDLDANSNHIYWQNWNRSEENYSTWRANLDGSEPQEFVSNSAGSPYVDLSAGRIFWAVESSGTYTFCRENLDGSDEKCIPSDAPVEYDRSSAGFRIMGVVNGSIAYWRYVMCIPGCYQTVAFTDFDTGEVKSLEDFPWGIYSLWTVENHIYWKASYGFWRTNIDGSDLEQIVLYRDPPGNRPYDIVEVKEFTLDLSENRACWVGTVHRDRDRKIVQCANLDRSGLDGSSIENLFDIPFSSFFGGGRYFVLDMAEERMFWLVGSEPRQNGFNIESEYSIWRASLDDPEPQKILSEVRKNVALRVEILAVEINPYD